MHRHRFLFSRKIIDEKLTLPLRNHRAGTSWRKTFAFQRKAPTALYPKPPNWCIARKTLINKKRERNAKVTNTSFILIYQEHMWPSYSFYSKCHIKQQFTEVNHKLCAEKSLPNDNAAPGTITQAAQMAKLSLTWCYGSAEEEYLGSGPIWAHKCFFSTKMAPIIKTRFTFAQTYWLPEIHDI